MKQHLWTGGLILRKTDRAQFGMVGATSQLTEEGTVLLHIRTVDVPTYVEHEGVNFKIPEAWASELAQKLLLVTTHISHLRSLHRRGFLAPQAVHDDEEVQPEGDRITDADQETVVAMDEHAPEPVGSTSVHVDADTAWLTYETAAGRARLLIEQVDALRTSRRAASPRKPPEHPLPFISKVERSRWRRERNHLIAVDEIDGRAVERQHFQIRFERLLVEALASRIRFLPPEEAHTSSG